MQNPHFEDSEVESEGQRLAVRYYGGSGPNMLLLHGLTHNLAVWNPISEYLIKKFRVAAFDQRGHGRSSPARSFRFREVAEDVDAVVSHLGLTKPILVAHSWTVGVALLYAAQNSKVLGVVCLDTNWMILGKEHWTPFEIKAPDIDAMFEEARTGGRSPKEPQALEEEIDAAGVRGTLREEFYRRKYEVIEGQLFSKPTLHEGALYWLALNERVAEGLTETLYEQIDAPIHLIFSTTNTGTRPDLPGKYPLAIEALAKRHSLGLNWIDGGHSLHFEKPEEVANLIFRATTYSEKI